MAKHGMISTTVGMSLGFLGIIGLVVSLLSLLPLNVYNMYIALNGLLELLGLELQKNPDWRSIPSDAAIYLVFLMGSVASSLITIVMVLATCFRSGQATANESDHVEAAMTEEVVVPKRRSVWLSRLGCIILVGQICLALFGLHILFMMETENVPHTVRKTTILSVGILCVNYLIITIFAFILFCASVFIVLGTKRVPSPHGRRTSTLSMSSSGAERTPLLK